MILAAAMPFWQARQQFEIASDRKSEPVGINAYQPSAADFKLRNRGAVTLPDRACNA